MTPCITPRKSRAVRRASVLFASLPVHTDFWLPGRKFAQTKIGIIRAIDNDGNRYFINPFRSVFTTAKKEAAPLSPLMQIVHEDAENISQKVADALAKDSPFQNLVQGGTFPVGVSAPIRAVGVPLPAPVPNPGQTHYVGDDCQGGHREQGEHGPSCEPSRFEKGNK